MDDIGKVYMPVLTRRSPKNMKWDSYEVFSGALSKISRTTVFNIKKYVTGRNEKLLIAVEYVTYTLVNDKSSLIDHIIRDLTINGT